VHERFVDGVSVSPECRAHTLYRLWRVVPEGPRNRYADLTVTGRSREAPYVHVR